MEIDVNVPRKQLHHPPSLLTSRQYDRPSLKEPTPGKSAEVVSEVVPTEMDYDGVVGRICDRCLVANSLRSCLLNSLSN